MVWAERQSISRNDTKETISPWSWHLNEKRRQSFWSHRSWASKELQHKDTIAFMTKDPWIHSVDFIFESDYVGNSGQIFAKIPLVYVTSLVKLLLDMKTHVGPPCKMLLIFPHLCEKVLSNIFLIVWESFQHYMHRITFVWWTLQTWLLTMQICGWNSSPSRHVF